MCVVCAGNDQDVLTNLGGVMAAHVLKDAESTEIDSIRTFEKVHTGSIGKRL